MGNGDSIKIWRDAWLGGQGTGKIVSPPSLLDKEATVASLIDRDRFCWRMDIINEVFLQVDVERISEVLISTSNPSDTRIWAASDYGLFRVRDAYALALRSQSFASSSNGSDPTWRKLCRLHIHPKAKAFLWRAAWDILSQGANLGKKGFVKVDRCKRCGMLENNTHVLLNCS